jgi:hypothetical protein
MRARFTKVRITDNRPPPRAGAISPVERTRATTGGSVAGMSGLDYLTASQALEAAEHDKNLRDYTPALVAAAWEDLSRRRVHDKKDQEHRWVMARRAALGRLAVSMRERGIA